MNIGYQVTLSLSGNCGCRSFSNYRTTVKPSSDNERSTHQGSGGTRPQSDRTAVNPIFDSIRSDQRYFELLLKMGLPTGA